MTLSPGRITNLLSLMAILLILAIICYSERVIGIIPCPLCMIQRSALIMAGAVVFVAILHHPQRWGRYIYGALLLLFSLVGFVTAARQLWLQSLPSDFTSATCSVDIYYLLNMLPFNEAMQKIFEGSVECSRVDWSLLVFSMAAWSLICFVALLSIALCQCFSFSRETK